MSPTENKDSPECKPSGAETDVYEPNHGLVPCEYQDCSQPFTHLVTQSIVGLAGTLTRRGIRVCPAHAQKIADDQDIDGTVEIKEHPEAPLEVQSQHSPTNFNSGDDDA